MKTLRRGARAAKQQRGLLSLRFVVDRWSRFDERGNLRHVEFRRPFGPVMTG